MHLYNYLLAGAGTAARAAPKDFEAPALDAGHAVADSDLVGPFQVTAPLTPVASNECCIVDADGCSIDAIEPGTDFYLRPAPGKSTATLTVKVPIDLHGRVLTGVALDAKAQRFTPVALAIPTETAIEFDISWESDNH